MAPVNTANPSTHRACANSIAILPMTGEMVRTVAELHRDAFVGYINTRIGIAYIRAFIDWFRQRDNTIALIAANTHDNRIVGYVIGAPVGYDKFMNRDLFWVATRGTMVRPWLLLSGHFRKKVATRLKLLVGYPLVTRTEPRLPSLTMSLVSIAVSPTARGKNIGSLLMREFELRAKTLNMRSLRLSVYPKNQAARHLYEISGWQAFCADSPTAATEMYYYRILDY